MGKRLKPMRKPKSKKKKNKEVSAEVNEEEEVSDEVNEEDNKGDDIEKDIEKEEKEIVAVNNVIDEEVIDILFGFTKDEKMSDELYSMYTASTSQTPLIELGNTASTSASTSLVDLGNPSIDLRTSQKPSIDPSIDLGNIASLIESDIDLGNTSLIESDIDLGNTASTSLIDIGSTKSDEKPLTVLSSYHRDN
jgi:hypothetical protein